MRRGWAEHRHGRILGSPTGPDPPAQQLVLTATALLYQRSTSDCIHDVCVCVCVWVFVCMHACVRACVQSKGRNDQNICTLFLRYLFRPTVRILGLFRTCFIWSWMSTPQIPRGDDFFPVRKQEKSLIFHSFCRVDGLMMNSHLFSSVFQCPVGSRMNPARKCSVWT